MMQFDPARALAKVRKLATNWTGKNPSENGATDGSVCGPLFRIALAVTFDGKPVDSFAPFSSAAFRATFAVFS